MNRGTMGDLPINGIKNRILKFKAGRILELNGGFSSKPAETTGNFDVRTDPWIGRLAVWPFDLCWFLEDVDKIDW